MKVSNKIQISTCVVYMRGVCVVFVWCLCGVCVVFVWCLFGVCVVFVWCLCVFCVFFVWCLCGVCVVFVCFLCVVCVVFVWCLCGTLYTHTHGLCGVCAVYVWCSYGVCVVHYLVPLLHLLTIYCTLSSTCLAILLVLSSFISSLINFSLSRKDKFQEKLTCHPISSIKEFPNLP